MWNYSFFLPQLEQLFQQSLSMKFLFFGHSPILAQLMHFKGNMLTQGALENVKKANNKRK